MKRLLIIFAAIFLAGCAAHEYPRQFRIYGDRLHVQGFAYDSKEDCLYSSFTSAFFKTDMEGNIVASVSGINGHLGAMTFDKKSRKAYASLELKDDAIGRGIASTLGEEAYSRQESDFYIAQIDVDALTGDSLSFSDIATLHPVADAACDYLAKVETENGVLDHRFGCSGIDGITIAPEIGCPEGKEDFLYVAYGIYGDTTRVDNDYNVLLCYALNNLKNPVHKYFVHTGNTRYGVQNMAYDSHSGRIYLAVYKGSKSQYPNYDLFSIDVRQKPHKGLLEGVPYHRDEVEMLEVDKAWHFKWGSTGLCPLGDGLYFISHNGKDNGRHYCDVTLYEEGKDELPFVQIL